jgi:multiple sugar transport system substrate-binding protein
MKLSRITLAATAAAALLSFGSGAFAQDFWAKAGEPYKGTTIRGVSESTPPVQLRQGRARPAVPAGDRHHVEFETTSWDQMYDKAIKDMEAGTGIYDFVYIEQDIIYSYLSRDFLVNITQSLNENQALKNPEFNPDEFTTFINYFKNETGDLFGVPMEAFLKVYLYRTDLFQQANDAFKAKHNRDLTPAKNHQEYREIAEFFTAWGKEQGQELWGTTVQAHTGHPASWYEFFESVAPTFGVYNWGIDANNNFAASVANGGQMNSDTAKAALEWWVGNLELAPPESTQSTWDEVAATFAAGRAAQGLVYGENAAWIATDPNKSQVVGKVGVALPPTAEGVMQAVEGGQGYIGYYDGGAFGIPATSKNKEAALLWLQFIAQPSSRRLGGRRLAHRAPGHLRRPEGAGAGQEDQRLLQPDARPGKALRRSASLPVPRPGPRGDRADVLAGHHRRAVAVRCARPDGRSGGAGTQKPRLPQVT